MPFQGSSLFLQRANHVGFVEKNCVNALSGLFFISTKKKDAKKEEKKTSVNALSGLFFISTFLWWLL